MTAVGPQALPRNEPRRPVRPSGLRPGRSLRGRTGAALHPGAHTEGGGMNFRGRQYLAAVTLLLGLGACVDQPIAPDPRTAQTAQARVTADRAASVIPDRYIVVFRDDVSDAPGLARQLAQSHGGKLHYTYQHVIKGFAATLPAGAVQALQRNPNVKYVENDGRVQ